jgi:hypothetical protein
MGDLKVCHVCGCTDGAPCTWFEVLGDGSTRRMACSWVAYNLCSECEPRGAAPAPLLYDAGGLPLVFR